MTEPGIPLEWVPTLTRRYTATLIDGLLVFGLFLVPAILWPADESRASVARFALVFAGLLAYEPVCTGHFATLGQLITRVRVRRFDTGGKIGVPRAYGRIVVKVFLGFISFLALPFTLGRRALHDMATGSIVIMAGSESDYAMWAAARRPAAPPESRGDNS